MRPTRPRTALEKRKAPTQARARGTVDAILQAAAYILTRHGTLGFTTNKIAERAGVNIASLYQYFPSKEAVLVELARRHAAEQRRRTLDILDDTRGQTLPKVARRIVTAMVAAHAVDPALHRVLTTESMRLRLPRFETEMDADLAKEARAFSERLRATRPDPDLAMWIASTAVHAVIHAALIERPAVAQSPVFVDEIVRLVTKYLALPRRRPRVVRSQKRSR